MYLLYNITVSMAKYHFKTKGEYNLKKLFFVRITAIALVFMLMLTAASCGKKASTKKTGGATAGEVSGSEIKVSQEFLDSLKGMSIKIAYPDKMRKPGEVAEDDAWAMLLTEVSNELGITIKEEYMFNKGNGSAFIADSLAGNDAGNIQMIWSTFAITGVRNNALAYLDDGAKEIGLDFKDEHYFTDLMKYGNLNGKQYTLAYKILNLDHYAVYYNVNMVTVENKLEDPYEVYMRGEWTFDKFEEYAKKLTKYDSSGAVTIYGANFPAAATLSQVIKANGGSFGKITGEGTWQETLSDAKTVRAFEYLQKWFYTDPCMNIPQGTWGTSFQQFWDGKAAMAIGSAQCAKDSVNRVLDEGGLGIVPLPVGPNGKQEDVFINDPAFVFTIPATYQENVAEYLYVMDVITSRWYNGGYEEAFALQYAPVFFQEKYYNMFYEYMTASNCTGVTPSGYSLVADADYYSPSYLMVEVTQGTSPATAVDRFKSPMQQFAKDGLGDIRYTAFTE